jgi:hypothetical protein
MDLTAVFFRTQASWRLVFVHAGRMVHFLALGGLGLAWLCCWLDRFRSRRDATGWIIPLKQMAAPIPRRPCLAVLAERYQPQPRTIDSLIRNKGVRV